MNVLRTAAVVAMLISAIVVPTTSARADAAADLHAFAARASHMTFADFAPLRGKQVGKGVWLATGAFGPSLSTCLIVDLPPLAAVFGTPAGDQPYSSSLQCDGARMKTSQDAILALAVKAMGPPLRGFTFVRFLRARESGRSTLQWKNATGLTVALIAYSARDYKDRDGSRLGYVVEVEQLSPDSLATPAPTATP